jgi:hypothetical protein
MAKVVLSSNQSAILENQGVDFIATYVDDNGNAINAPENIDVYFTITDFNGVIHDEKITINSGNSQATYTFSDAYDNKVIDDTSAITSHITKVEAIRLFGSTQSYDYDNTEVNISVNDYITDTYLAIVASDNNEDSQYTTFKVGFYGAQTSDIKTDFSVLLDIKEDGNSIDENKVSLTKNSDGYYEIDLSSGELYKSFKIET